MSGDSDKPPSRLRAFTGVTLAIFPLINYKPSRKYYIEENPGTSYKLLCFLFTLLNPMTGKTIDHRSPPSTIPDYMLTELRVWWAMGLKHHRGIWGGGAGGGYGALRDLLMLSPHATFWLLDELRPRTFHKREISIYYLPSLIFWNVVLS